MVVTGARCGRLPRTSMATRDTGSRRASASRGTTVTPLGTPWLPYMMGSRGTGICQPLPGGRWFTRSA